MNTSCVISSIMLSHLFVLMLQMLMGMGNLVNKQYINHLLFLSYVLYVAM